VAAALLVLAWIPYGIGFRKDSSSSQFMGLICADCIDDNNVYLGLMRQAAEGRFLFTNNFTSEPNPPALFNLIYLVLGRIAGWTGWSVAFVHLLFGGFSIVLLVLLAYRFIATAVRKPVYRRLALVLACFGMGLLWMARLVDRVTGVRFKTIDSWLAETSVFHTMLVYPHFVFAAGLMVGTILLLLRADRTGRLAPAFLGGLCAAALAVSHTFEVVVLLPAAVGFLLVDGISRGRLPSPRRWLCLALVVGLPVPMLIANSWILRREPMWGNTVARLDFYTPDPFRLALGLGVGFFIVLLTYDGLFRADRSAGEQMAKVWVVTAFVFSYVPMFNWQFHLLNGIQIPLAILATQGLRRTAFRAILARRRTGAGPWWPAGLRGRRGVLAAAAATVVVCCLSSVNLLLSYCHEAGRVQVPTYLPKEQVVALEWMSREVPREALVLSTYATGNYIPRLSGQRVFIGEDKLTEAADLRMSEVAGFFGADWSDEARLDLLRRFGVDYVFYGPAERAAGGYDPSRAPFLVPVHQEGDVRIYRVSPDAPMISGVAGSAHPGGQP
jgi:hypothetical protein